MNTIYYLSTCNTCSRILGELKLDPQTLRREIKTEPLSAAEIDRLATKAGSYEAIFNKRARLLSQITENRSTLSEPDYRKLLLEHYSFLKRPLLETPEQVIAGSSKDTISKMQALT